MKLIKLALASRKSAAEPELRIVRRFLSWSQAAADEQRVNVATMLARAYLSQALPDQLRPEFEICLALIVEDASTSVRRALAIAIADADTAPPHIVLALADDRPEIAAIVLAKSPVLTEAELNGYAALGGDGKQLALARRSNPPASLAAFLAENGRPEAAIALIENRQASIASEVIRQIADRFTGDGAVRQALLKLPKLPASVRYDLLETTVRAQPSPVARIEFSPERATKPTRDSRERSVIQAANLSGPGEARDLVRDLRAEGALTAALLMRSLISGSRIFFEAAASELSGLDPERVAGLVLDPFGPGFAALYRRMGLPALFLAPFRAALNALEELRGGASGASRSIASGVISACERLAPAEIGQLIALLRRLEMEAALGEAQALRSRFGDVGQYPANSEGRRQTPAIGGLDKLKAPSEQAALRMPPRFERQHPFAKTRAKFA